MNNYPTIGHTDFGGQIKETINARELYAFLKSKRDFATWVKDKLKRFGFVEGVDYLLHKFLERVGEKMHGGQNRIDYFLTVDTTKHFALTENTEVGRQYRQHLIARDEELRVMHEGLAAPSPTSDLDYGHTAELADHARVRLALKLGGKAYAIKLWNETAFGQKNPIAAVGGAPVKASASYRGGEAYAVLCDFLDNPRYPALLHSQLQQYIIAGCDLKPSYEELRVIIRQAGIATRCVRVGRHKVAKVKIFTDEVLTIADIRQSIADFKAAE